jgi:hypothetical protein
MCGRGKQAVLNMKSDSGSPLMSMIISVEFARDQHMHRSCIAHALSVRFFLFIFLIIL